MSTSRPQVMKGGHACCGGVGAAAGYPVALCGSPISNVALESSQFCRLMSSLPPYMGGRMLSKNRQQWLQCFPLHSGVAALAVVSLHCAVCLLGSVGGPAALTLLCVP
eukprot:1138963-Pelagomonas_calceolata.AAC.12